MSITDRADRGGGGPTGPPPAMTGASGEADVRMVLPALVVLTAVSGIVDAASYLGLGHVFTANMTGNVVILGFSAAGAPGFSAAACLVSLAAFIAGAATAGRLTPPGAATGLLGAVVCEVVLVGAAAVIGLAEHGAVSVGWPRFAVTGLLGFAMGTRNSAVRRFGVADMTTTVLTMTMTGLASDVAVHGGTPPRAGRRIASVVTMFAGALLGAFLYLHHGTGWALVGAAAASVGAAALLIVRRGSDTRRTPRSAPHV